MASLQSPLALLGACTGFVAGLLIWSGLASPAAPGAWSSGSPNGGVDAAPPACPSARAIKTVFNATISNSSTRLKTDMSMTVEADGVSPPDPNFATRDQPSYGSLGPTGTSELANCIVPIKLERQNFTPTSIAWREGKIRATFRIDAYIRRKPIDYGTVRITVPWHELTDMYIDICAPQPMTTESGKKIVFSYSSYPDLYRPFVCKSYAHTTVNVAVFGTTSSPQVFGGAGKDAGIPSLDLDSELRDLPPPVIAKTMPNSQIEGQKRVDLVWQFNGIPKPIEFAFGLPLRLRVGLYLNDDAFFRGRLMIYPGYLVWTTGALTTILIAGLLAFRTTAQLREKLSFVWFTLGTTIATALAEGLVIPGFRYGWALAPAIFSATGWAFLLTVTNYSNKAFRSMWLGIGMLVVACTAGTILEPNYLNPPREGLVSPGDPRIAYGFTFAILALCLVGTFSYLSYVLSTAKFLFYGRFVRDAAVRSWFATGAFATNFVVFFMIGGKTADGWSENGLPQAVQNLSHASGDVLVHLLPFFAVAFLVRLWLARVDSGDRQFRRPWNHIGQFSSHFFRSWRRRKERRVNALTLGALLLAITSTWLDMGSFAFIVMIPVWLVQFALLALLLNQFVSWRPCPPAVSGERSTLIGALRNPALQHSTVVRADRETSRLLQLGPHEDRHINAVATARIAALLSAAPVIYLVINTLRASQGDRGGTSAFLAASVALTEIGRWVVTGYIFGFLYPGLPGKSGPTKALCLAGFWSVSFWAAIGVAAASNSSTRGTAMYRWAEFVVFVVVLGVLYDWVSVRAAEGTWLDLRKIYIQRNYAEAFAVAAPLLLALATLVEQVLSNAGLEVAKAFVSALSALT